MNIALGRLHLMITLDEPKLEDDGQRLARISERSYLQEQRWHQIEAERENRDIARHLRDGRRV